MKWPRQIIKILMWFFPKTFCWNFFSSQLFVCQICVFFWFKIRVVQCFQILGHLVLAVAKCLFWLKFSSIVPLWFSTQTPQIWQNFNKKKISKETTDNKIWLNWSPKSKKMNFPSSDMLNFARVISSGQFTRTVRCGLQLLEKNEEIIFKQCRTQQCQLRFLSFFYPYYFRWSHHH